MSPIFLDMHVMLSRNTLNLWATVHHHGHFFNVIIILLLSNFVGKHKNLNAVSVILVTSARHMVQTCLVRNVPISENTFKQNEQIRSDVCLMTSKNEIILWVSRNVWIARDQYLVVRKPLEPFWPGFNYMAACMASLCITRVFAVFIDLSQHHWLNICIIHYCALMGNTKTDGYQTSLRNSTKNKGINDFVVESEPKQLQHGFY